MPPIDEPLPRISEVTLKTADMARSVAFYEALGFGRPYAGPKADFTSLAVGSGCLNLQLDRDYGPGAVWGRVIFRVDDVDAFATNPPLALGQGNLDPDQPVPFQSHAAFLSDFPAVAIDALVGLAGPNTATLLASVEIVHPGGALARPAPGGGAQPSVDANYLLTAVGATPTPDLAAAVRAQAHAVKDAIAPWHASYDYYNSEESPAPASAVLPPASYRRLQNVKAVFDPDQTIISAHPVRPSVSSDPGPYDAKVDR